MVKKGSRVLLLEQREGGIMATVLEANERAKMIRVRTQREFRSFDAFTAAQKTAGNCDRAVVALDAAHAATIKGVVRATRENPEATIGAEELDALLFHALWNFLNRYRPLAAKKLGVSELELVVGNIAVCGVRIHGHKVFNPLDFKGGELVIEFRVTFVTRALLPTLERLSASFSEAPMVIERGALLSESLGGDNVLVDIGDHMADVYITKSGETTHLGRCAWGNAFVTSAIGRYFGVPDAIVGDVLRQYAKNQISERMRNALTAIARKEVAAMKDLVAKTAKRAMGKERIPVRTTAHGRARLPNDFVDDGRIRIAVFRDPEPVEQFSFRAGSRIAEIAAEERAALITLVYYPYMHPQYVFLNQLLHRRVKWLVPHEG